VLLKEKHGWSGRVYLRFKFCGGGYEVGVTGNGCTGHQGGEGGLDQGSTLLELKGAGGGKGAGERSINCDRNIGDLCGAACEGNLRQFWCLIAWKGLLNGTVPPSLPPSLPLPPPTHKLLVVP